MNIEEVLSKIGNTPIGGYVESVVDNRLDIGCDRNDSFNSGFSWAATIEGNEFWGFIYSFEYDKAWKSLSAKQKNAGVMHEHTRSN